MDAVTAPGAIEGITPPADNAMVVLQSLTSGDMARVNTLIMDRIASQAALVPELAGYTVSSGGKRLRPMLTVAAAHIGYVDGNKHISLAAAVEFMHTATLLHDDVVDDSALRRGRHTARVIWDNRSSVLVGDFLLGRAFELMVEAGSHGALEVLSRAASVIAEGEVMQLAAAKDINTTEDTCLRVIDAKTATLFAAAMEAGALAAGLAEDKTKALQAYGRNLGIAFQLVDDALDYSGKPDAMGKQSGDDFREGKITLPVVLAMAAGADSERDFWRRTLGEEASIQDGDFEHARALLEHHNALTHTLARAQHYGAQAREALAPVPDSLWREALVGLVDFCVHRTH